MTTPRRALLEEAAEIISVDRAATHGRAENSFATIAGVWNWWLSVRPGGPLTAVDVAIMMDLFKTARIANNPTHRDNWLDKAGYSALGYEIATKGDVDYDEPSEH
jgi:hypothetical protein